MILTVPIRHTDDTREPDLPDGVGYTDAHYHDDGTVTVQITDQAYIREREMAPVRLMSRISAKPILAAEDTLTASDIEDLATIFPTWLTGTAYAVGDVVSFDGRLWECRQAHTSQDDWTPPEVLALWYKYRGVDDPDETPAWEAATPYSVGDLVTYQGTTYRCLQAHTSIVTWEPPNVPALWEVA